MQHKLTLPMTGDRTTFHTPRPPMDPNGARKRLIEAGVDFKTSGDAAEITSTDYETYRVATLVFEAT